MARARTRTVARPRRSVVGTALRVGASFDWISPVAAIAQDIANGPSYTFLLTDGGGLTGRQIIGLLHDRGIKTWGHMLIDETLCISVRKRDARRAGKILSRAGVS